MKKYVLTASKAVDYWLETKRRVHITALILAIIHNKSSLLMFRASQPLHR